MDLVAFIAVGLNLDSVKFHWYFSVLWFDLNDWAFSVSKEKKLLEPPLYVSSTCVT